MSITTITRTCPMDESGTPMAASLTTVIPVTATITPIDMLDDFLVRAIAAGIGVALVAGPLGCFVVWRRLAYYGDTLSHAALLGIALGVLIQINLTLSVFVIALAVSIGLLSLQRRADMSSDALLGLMSHGALALGLVVLSLISGFRVDLLAFLFGDILAVTNTDLLIIYIGALLVLATLVILWRRLFAATVDHELAIAEGINPDRVNLFFMILMAATIAIAMKVVGALLITALLIIPAATARRFVNGPEAMAIVAVVIGIIAVITGLLSSLNLDTPAGPSIVVAALILFLISLSPAAAMLTRRKKT
jgi:zinc transport system permease protein